MELASMLAGEPFTDHPRCASRTVAALLRCYNDTLDDRRRQDLYAYAAKVVGSAGSPGIESARARRLVQWTDELQMQRGRSRLLTRRRRRAGLEQRVDPESAARSAIRAIRRVSDATHTKVLALIDELIALRTPADRAITEESLTGSFEHRRDVAALT